MKCWKVGIVGVGVLCNQGAGYGTLFNEDPRTSVTGICDIAQTALEKAGRNLGLDDNQLFTDYDEFIGGDLDIVFIGTPIPYHAEQAIKAMENGKHVLCEVTAADTLDECEKLVGVQKKTGMTYMMAENYCYFNYIREWKKMIDCGKLGKIFYAEGEYVHPIRNMIVDEKTGKTYWRANRPPLHYCSHSLGPLLMLMDDRIIKATGSGKGINIISDVGPGAIDMQVAIFETQKGTIIKLLRSSVAPREPYLVFYSLYGTRGYVENVRGLNEGKALFYIEGEMKKTKMIDAVLNDPSISNEKIRAHGTSEYLLLNDFLNALENRTKPPIDIVRAMDFTVPGILAHEAAMKGNVWLDVPLLE